MALRVVPKTPIRFVRFNSIILAIVALFATEARRGKDGRFVAFATIFTSFGFIRDNAITSSGRISGSLLRVIAPDDKVGSINTFSLEIWLGRINGIYCFASSLSFGVRLRSVKVTILCFSSSRDRKVWFKRRSVLESFAVLSIEKVE